MICLHLKCGRIIIAGQSPSDVQRLSERILLYLDGLNTYTYIDHIRYMQVPEPSSDVLEIVVFPFLLMI